ncbi:MAG: hypothetical protein HYX68_04480 [Planctomycetes bacterium]|nr:hypothetical protein [Planctomycetota bacterium]
MKSIRLIIGVAGVWMCAAIAHAQVIRELDPKVIEAWKKAGAGASWCWYDSLGRLKTLKTRPNESAALPTFFCPKFKPESIAKLPDPGQPFGIIVRGTGVTDRELKEFAKFTSLCLLVLSGQSVLGGDGAVTDSGLTALAGLKNLQTLALERSDVTDEGMKTIGKLARLRHLDLWGVGITGRGLKELAPLKNLRCLMLSSVGDSDLKEITRFTDLETLVLSAAEVTDKEMRQLKSLKKLRTLNLGRTKITDIGLKEIATLAALENLSVHRTKITDAGLKEIAALPRLQFLNLQETAVTDAGLKLVGTIKSLRKLDLIASRKVSKSGIEHLKKDRPDLNVVGP